MAIKTLTPSRWPHDTPPYRLKTEAQKIEDSLAELRTLLNDKAITFDIALAASSTTDGMDITITAKDMDGNTVAEAVPFEWWISEAATGIGLTADSYSGTVTASVGAIHTAITAKKHFLGITATTGIFTATAVDSANPADQYVAAKTPLGGVVVSAVSGTNWQGA